MTHKHLKAMIRYGASFLYWAAAGVMIGALCGVAGGLFAMAVEWATHTREHHSFLVYLLPLGGVAIVGLYRLLRLPISIGTDAIFSTVRSQKKVPLQLAPAIFTATTLTHLLGGSAGREGAALQLGGSLGAAAGRILHPHSDGRRVFELCGMAALFSALFGTPITAAIFVIEVVEVGRVYGRALLPCIAAAVTAQLIARAIGAPAELFPLAGGLAQVTGTTLLQSGGLGVFCALTAMLFCLVMHNASGTLKKLIPNDFLRAAAGGVAVVLLSLLLGRDYLGGGMHTILNALSGQALPWAFLLKLVFTAVSLGSGFKGGEIVPSFFVGSTMGCTAAALLGMSPALGAGLGLIGVFCGVTNAPLASMVLSVELFGAEYLPLFGVVCGVSYMLSGHHSLYHSQVFAEPKMGHRD